MATVVGTLVLAGLILLVMLSREEQRRLAELRTTRARRLRYLKDGKHGKVDDEVTLDSLPNDSQKKELLNKLHPKTPKSDLGLIPHAGPFHVFRAMIGIGHTLLHSRASTFACAAHSVCTFVCACAVSHNWLHGQNTMRIVKTRLRELLPDVEVRRPPQSCAHGAQTRTIAAGGPRV
jgi:hypothetical protein